MRRSSLLALLIGSYLVWPASVSAQMGVHTVSLATDASGDQTVYTAPTFGRVVAIRYVPDATDPMDTTSDLTITDNATGIQLLTATNLGAGARDWFPRAAMLTTTGVAITYDGTREVHDEVPVAGAIKVVVAQGGASNEGALYVYVEGR